MTALALIGCTARKLDRAAPARELYRGRLFAASVAYAESRGLSWAVLSAAHGIVMPDDRLEPYDVRLRGDTSAWGSLVLTQLRRLCVERVVALAGEAYVTPWAWSFAGEIERPLVGLGVGARYAELMKITGATSATRAA